MNDFNSTEFFGEDMNLEDGGEQENVVDSQESQYDGYDAAGEGQEEAVDPQEDGGDAEHSEEGAEAPEVADQGGRKKQTREDNSAARMARLRAERETEARVAAAADERIARSGVLNPATGKPFRSMQELESYGAAQREAEVQRLAKQTGRSVEDVRSEIEDRDFLRKMREEDRARRDAAAQVAKRMDFMRRDGEDFKEKYPGIDIGKLENNESFRRFCGSRFGVESLASLYEDYRAVVGGAASAGRAGAESRSRRATGSGGGGGEMLTAKQRASLDAWNRANPDMKMTAKEFLGK